MLGIPFRMLRQDDERGPVDTTIYLRTRRSGDSGKAMTTAKRDYHKAQMAAAKAAQRYASADRRIKELPADSDKIEELEDKRDGYLDEIQAHADAAREAALKLVQLSLRENYGAEDVESVLDHVTDEDLDVLVQAIETGETPADFFAGGARPPEPSTTTPSGGESGTSSSPEDSRPETLNEET